MVACTAKKASYAPADDHADRLLAITTTGDGNCLYTAVSLGIGGNKIICTT